MGGGASIYSHCFLSFLSPNDSRTEGVWWKFRTTRPPKPFTKLVDKVTVSNENGRSVYVVFVASHYGDSHGYLKGEEHLIEKNQEKSREPVDFFNTDLLKINKSPNFLVTSTLANSEFPWKHITCIIIYFVLHGCTVL